MLIQLPVISAIGGIDPWRRSKLQVEAQVIDRISTGLNVNGIGGPWRYSISRLQLDDVKNKLRSEVISILRA
jgi:hypothetical protein